MGNRSREMEELYMSHPIEREYDDPDAVREKYPPDWNYRQGAIINYNNETCARCRVKIGSDPSAEDFHVHHIIPLHKRGSHHLQNLTPLCVYCHALIHPDNDELADWTKAPLLPDRSADHRVAVERLPQTDKERSAYDSCTSPDDFEHSGDVNAYARSQATTDVVASVAVKKTPTDEDHPVGEYFDHFCDHCNELLKNREPTCPNCSATQKTSSLLTRIRQRVAGTIFG